MFAVLNRPAKIAPMMIRLWARILLDVPGSELMVLAGTGNHDATARAQWFADHGVARERLVLVERGPRTQYLARYQSVDIALDTFPYNGHTTTCDALWMGVPVVSLVGETHAARAGLSVLRAAGLERLAAATPEAYVRTATDLARDLAELEVLRHGLRFRMKASPLCDGPRLTRLIEEAYRRMWAQWCRGIDRRGQQTAAAQESL
jgi:predicted O-linked N-acetylglucosamine transferase (SPINDLY family)